MSPGAQRLWLSDCPLQHHALGCGVGNGVGLPVSEQDHLVKGIPLGVRERPAPHPPVVGDRYRADTARRCLGTMKTSRPLSAR